MKLLKRFFWSLLCALSLAAPSLAVETEIRRISIVVGHEQAARGEIARNVEQALRQVWPRLAIEITDKERFIPNQNQPTLVIALGDALQPWVAAHSDAYSAAIVFYAGAAAFTQHHNNNAKLTALFRDQPLQRQLALAKLLNPHLHRAAILRSEKPLPQSVAELEQHSGIAITAAVAAQPSEWPKLLAQIMRNNDVLLGIDDTSLYNSETIRSILLTAYRHGKGVIGPSSAFVTAGSLASCYTSPDQYLQQLLAMAATVIDGHTLPPPQYPKQFSVVVNAQVAASLGLVIPDEAILNAWPQNYRGGCGNDC